MIAQIIKGAQGLYLSPKLLKMHSNVGPKILISVNIGVKISISPIVGFEILISLIIGSKISISEINIKSSRPQFKTVQILSIPNH